MERSERELRIRAMREAHGISRKSAELYVDRNKVMTWESAKWLLRYRVKELWEAIKESFRRKK